MVFVMKDTHTATYSRPWPEIAPLVIRAASVHCEAEGKNTARQRRRVLKEGGMDGWIQPGMPRGLTPAGRGRV